MKTIEEISLLVDKYLPADGVGTRCEHDRMELHNAIYKLIADATRWKDPKEEMPEVGEFVQVKCERDSVWHDHDKVILDRFGNKKFEYMPYYVIGWRPIE